MSLSLAIAPHPLKSRLKPWLATAWRYGLSASGPVATSGAHFLASLLFVRNLAAASFGLFSFVLVIVPFAMSATAALLVIPVTRSLGDTQERREQIAACCLKLNLLLSALAMLGVFAALLAARSTMAPAILLGAFGGALTFRWFGRCYAYVEGRMKAAVASDMAYALCLVAGLGILALSHHVSLVSGAAMMLAAALVALAPLGKTFFAEQWAAIGKGRLGLYGGMFRDVTRWSLLGVVFTEMTVNAHAYLVTFIAGPGTFALLALGMLLMRPASLVQSALPDLERPLMTRQIAARDWPALDRTRREFGFGLIAVLLATLALDAVLLIWFPSLILKRGYGLHDVVLVGTLSAIIMAVRALRAPPSVHLQAAGWFKQLAAIGTSSSVISILATLALLLLFGPIASLGGVLLGELVILLNCWRLMREWRAQNV
jgi:hypothetical protein